MEHGLLTPILEVEGVTAGDMGAGKVIGPENFYIDGENIYVLASEDKELLYFNNGELIKNYNLDYMNYPTVVKVNNNSIYILDGRAKLYELNRDGVVLYEDIIKPEKDKWPRVKDIRFDKYGKPILINYDDSAIKLKKDSKEEEFIGLYFENSEGISFKIKDGKVVSPDSDFELKIKSLGSGASNRELLYIDKNDNFYVSVFENGLRTLRKYDWQGKLIGICKLPSDIDKIVHYPGKPTIVKDMNNIFTMINYKGKTVIYKVQLGKELY
ncbi:MAG: hypothetical protein ACOC1N_04225 [Bacillota bacterium]